MSGSPRKRMDMQSLIDEIDNYLASQSEMAQLQSQDDSPWEDETYFDDCDEMEVQPLRIRHRASYATLAPEDSASQVGTSQATDRTIFYDYDGTADPAIRYRGDPNLPFNFDQENESGEVHVRTTGFRYDYDGQLLHLHKSPNWDEDSQHSDYYELPETNLPVDSDEWVSIHVSSAGEDPNEKKMGVIKVVFKMLARLNELGFLKWLRSTEDLRGEAEQLDAKEEPKQANMLVEDPKQANKLKEETKQSSKEDLKKASKQPNKLKKVNKPSKEDLKKEAKRSRMEELIIDSKQSIKEAKRRFSNSFSCNTMS